MLTSRRLPLQLLGLTLLGLSAARPALAHDDDLGEDRGAALAGRVFTSSNASSGNQLLTYARQADGSLALVASTPTGGLGTARGLGSQGAVTLSRDGRHLFVVNAQSDDVSTFALHPGGARLLSVTPSGGLHPISVTENEGLVYVLNDGGAGNVVGFRHIAGQLKPLKDAVQGLSAAGGTAPAQVGLSGDGDTLIVTEKGTNKVLSYAVSERGALSKPTVTASPGVTPFGFAFNRRDRLVVTEAWGGAAGASTVSSYRFHEHGGAQPELVSAAVPDLQGAACWVAATPDGHYAFVANTGSSDVSSYRIDKGGEITLQQAVAGHTGTGSSPADTAVSADGRHLFVRNGGSFTLASFRIDDEGRLLAAPLTPGLPATAVGLAAN
jgi:6-phosphogluconolactonase (cycloisomerase 2 family)